MRDEERLAATLQVETVSEDTDDPPASVERPPESAEQAGTSARLYLVGAAIYALYPALVRDGTDGFFGTAHDAGTLGMAVGLLALAAALQFVDALRSRPAVLNGIAAYLISAHMLVIAWQRSLDTASVVAVLIVMAAMVTSLPFTMPSRVVLQGYALLMAAGALLVGLAHPDPVVPPRILLFSVGALVVVALVSQTAWLRIVGRVQAAERTRRTVVRNAPIALFALDPDGRVRMAEGKGLVGLGIDPRDLVGKTLEPSGDVPAVLRPALSARAGPFGELVLHEGRTYEAVYEPLGERGGRSSSSTTSASAPPRRRP